MTPINPNLHSTTTLRQSFRRRSLCHWLLALGLLLASLGAHAGTLQATVDRNHLAPEETFRLSLRYDSQVLMDEPDFSQLEQNFEVLNTQRSNQFRSINGKNQSWTEWTLTLAPRREGTLLIPSFKLKGSFSDAIEITVQASADDPAAAAARDVFLQTELQPEEAYVQQQVLYTIRLFTRVPLSGLNRAELKIDNAQFRQVEETQYRKTIAGVDYGVVEIVYALFPQQSGTLAIPATVWEVTAPDNSSRSYDPFGRSAGKRLRLRTAPSSLLVKPKPASYDARIWLPADSLQLTEEWSGRPERMQVGEPITRRLTLRGDGVLAAQLPPLQLGSVDGLRYYPDQPQSEETLSRQGVNTRKTESYAIVANKPGHYTLPPVTLDWWDSRSGQQRQLTLPAREIEVAAASSASQSEPTAAAPSPAQPLDAESLTDKPPTLTTPSIRGSFWFYTTLVLAALSLLLSVLWLRARAQLSGGRPAPASPYDRLSRDDAEAFKALRIASGKDDLPALRQALQNWAQLFWQARQALRPAAERRATTAALPSLCEESPALSESLQQLDAALYGDSSRSDFDGRRLMEAVIQLRQNSHADPAETPLPPLYRSH